MSGRTIAEKIIAKACGRSVEPGDIVVCKVELALMPDTTPRRICKDLAGLGGRVWDPQRVVLVLDHYSPAKDIEEAEIERQTRLWAEKQGIGGVHQLEGVCHRVIAERGYVVPSMFMVGSDSHTCTSGALGAFAMGLGATDMLGVLVTGETWLRVPEVTEIKWQGRPPAGVMAKDMILQVMKRLGLDGASWKALEFRGEAVRNLCLDERMTLTNMAIETGATTAIIEPDDVVLEFLNGRARTSFTPTYSDPDCSYQQTVAFTAAEIEPLVACPHRPDKVVPAKSLEAVDIDQAYLGSCTGGKHHDLATAAEVLRERTVAPGVRLIFCPASRDVLREIERDGTLRTLLDAGGTLVSPGCGACAGHRDGVLAGGEVCISSTNRNFRGRMGSAQADVYLASPATVAASAIKGRVADPREFLS